MATRAPANKLEARFCQQLSNALRLHRVVLVFDPDEQLQPLFTDLRTSNPTEEKEMTITKTKKKNEFPNEVGIKKY